MAGKLWSAAVALSTLLSANAFPASSYLHSMGAQGINLLKLRHTQPSSKLRVQDPSQVSFGLKEAEFPPYYFQQPLDHFTNDSQTFGQRYWFSTRHYTPGAGGPVIVLEGGETSGEDRLPFLDTGILDILTSATGGIGVVLEHRYYGDSIPVANFSTDSMRWLNNDQAAADSANFIANIKFPGIEEDLTAPSTPWIYYGGSYAGARAAHMRILYPDLVYGAISSSGVTHASLSNWEYMEIIRNAADPKCSGHLEKTIEMIDSLLEIPLLKGVVKNIFGLKGLEHDEDFVSVLSSPLGSWQDKVWDPAVGSNEFDEFCEALAKPPYGLLSSSSEAPFGDASRLITLEDGEGEGLALDFAVLNYGAYIKKQYVDDCTDIEECFGTFDAAKFQDTSLSQTWRAWTFQVCTEWGYFTTAPPDQNHPRIISKLITLEYESQICHQAFPPGKFFSVPALPNVTVVNALGDFAIAADRLAIIDGEVDPWRPQTPHSEYAEDREDTVLRPFKLIPNGVHHYDEYGLKEVADEPTEIRQVHGEMVLFVERWLRDWKALKA